MKVQVGIVLGCPVSVVSPERGESFPIVEGQDNGWKYEGDLRDDNILTGLLSWVNPKVYHLIARKAGIPITTFQKGDGDLLHKATLVVAVALYYGWLEIDQYPTPVLGDGTGLAPPLTLWGIKNGVKV